MTSHQKRPVSSEVVNTLLGAVVGVLAAVPVTVWATRNAQDFERQQQQSQHRFAAYSMILYEYGDPTYVKDMGEKHSFTLNGHASLLQVLEDTRGADAKKEFYKSGKNWVHGPTDATKAEYYTALGRLVEQMKPGLTGTSP